MLTYRREASFSVRLGGYAISGRGMDVLSVLRLVVFAVALAFVFVFYAVWIHVLADRTVPNDFTKFYASAVMFLQDQDIYAPIPTDFLGALPQDTTVPYSVLHPNLNPPFQTLVFAPLALLSHASAFYLWSTLSLAAGVAGALLVGHATGLIDGRSWRVLGVVALVLIYYPTLMTITLGQLSLVLLLLVAVAWTAARSNYDRVAGIVLGITFVIKIFTGLFLVLFLLLGRWRLSCWYIGTALACVTTAVALAGPESHLRYFEVLREITWYSASWNASLLGFFTRIFGGSEGTPIVEAPGLAHVLSYLLSLLGIFALADVTRGEAKDSPMLFDVSFSLCIVLMLLISPLGWMYYFPLLVIPMFVILSRAKRFNASMMTTIMMLAWLLTSAPLPLMPSNDAEGFLAIFTVYNFYFYALALISATLFILARRGHGPADEGQRDRSVPVPPKKVMHPAPMAWVAGYRHPLTRFHQGGRGSGRHGMDGGFRAKARGPHAA